MPATNINANRNEQLFFMTFFSVLTPDTKTTAYLPRRLAHLTFSWLNQFRYRLSHLTHATKN